MPSITGPSEGPVAVTGAAGYIGSHVVLKLVQAGYDVCACVRNALDHEKVAHLNQMNHIEGCDGSVTLYEADMTVQGAYDEAFSDATCVFHVAAEMGNLPGSTPMKVYEGGRLAIVPVMDSVKKSGSVRRFIFTSSFAAVGHGGRTRPFTEDSWAYFTSSDDHTPHENWTMDVVRVNRDIAYSMTKVDTENYCYEEGEKSGGQFDCFGIMPWTVVGPVLCARHNIQFGWQSMVGDLMNGFSHRDMNYNIIDVRDVAEAQLRIAESDAVSNGDRYNLVCHGDDGFITLAEVKQVLQAHFPGKGIGTGLHQKKSGEWVESTNTGGTPPAVLEKCITQLGMTPIPPAQSLIDNAESLVSMGLVNLREGEDNYQKDFISPPGGKGKTSGSLGIESTWLAEGYPAGLNAPEFEEGAGERELSAASQQMGAKL